MQLTIVGRMELRGPLALLIVEKPRDSWVIMLVVVAAKREPLLMGGLRLSLGVPLQVLEEGIPVVCVGLLRHGYGFRVCLYEKPVSLAQLV